MPVAVLALTSLLAAGCGTKTFDDPDRFEQYVTSDIGPFVQSKAFEHVTVNARFATPEVMALSATKRLAEARAQLVSDTETPDSVKARRLADLKERATERKKQYGSSLYFYLTIEPKEGDLVYSSLENQGFGAYQQWIRKLLFGLQEKITLTTDTVEEVPLSVYRMDRTFGMSKSRTFLLAFPSAFNASDLTSSPVTLVIEEFGLRTGRIRFTFDIPTLQNAASLRIPG